jgi:hypothetical protein
MLDAMVVMMMMRRRRRMTTMMITNYPHDNGCLNVGYAAVLKGILNLVHKIAGVNLNGHKS